MQQVHLWAVTSDEKLREIPSDQIDLEGRLEDWLAGDISLLDPDLLVIGKQVLTDFGGKIDLLCLDSAGDTVVVELKRGRTPREVTAQALDYASWVRDLSRERIEDIAEQYLNGPDALQSAFQDRFEEPLPGELNLKHRSLIVAESMDASTVRIVRYLSSMNVPINVATIQHFKDETGRSILAQVYLIEPEEAEARSQPTSRRAARQTMKGFHDLAEANGLGGLYARVREGARGILSAQPYRSSMFYRLRRDDGSVRTVLIIEAIRNKENSGLKFTVHATRLMSHLGIDLDELRSWLPENSREEDVSTWAGSSQDERKSARGLRGFFQSDAEVDKFIDELRKATARSRTT